MMERRQIAAECRASGDGGRTFAGEAIVYGAEVLIGSQRFGFYETIAHGAARDSIASDDIIFLDAHDPARPLARTSAGTLRLTDTPSAVAVSCDEIPATSYGDDLVTNLRVGNVRGMSFGFDVIDDTWATREVALPNGGSTTVETRMVNTIKLYEVSTTAFPAYPTTSAAVRDAFRHKPSRHGITYDEACVLRDAIATELRDGKTISAANMDTLQNVLDLIAAADTAVDQAQPLLAALMGVPNPDADDDEDESGDAGDEDGAARGIASIHDRRLSALAAFTGLAIPA